MAAVAGALQYWPNFVSVWYSSDAPAAWARALAAFWFDVDEGGLARVDGARRRRRPACGDRLAMWWFDARQQFGVAGLVLAAVGAVAPVAALAAVGRALVLGASSITTLFALTYNVGDSHVFFCRRISSRRSVPARAQGAMWHGWRDVNPSRSSSLTRLSSGALIGIVALGYVRLARHGTWPAVDRHRGPARQRSHRRV